MQNLSSPYIAEKSVKIRPVVPENLLLRSRSLKYKIKKNIGKIYIPFGMHAERAKSFKTRFFLKDKKMFPT